MTVSPDRLPIARMAALYGAILLIAYPAVILAVAVSEAQLPDLVSLAIEGSAIFAVGKLASRRLDCRPLWSDMLWIAILATGLGLVIPILLALAVHGLASVALPVRDILGDVSGQIWIWAGTALFGSLFHLGFLLLGMRNGWRRQRLFQPLPVDEP